MCGQAKKRVLILGGGFGGVYAARHLDSLAGSDKSLEITLINRENFFLFTPMLHEVAASDLEITNIVSPIRELVRHVKFFCGEVESVDLDKKTVCVSHGYGRHSHDLQYDYLIIALGCTTNFFKLPGVQEHAITMKSLGDAIHLRNRLVSHLEEADSECAAKDREGLQTFVVAGGGFAGVETIGSINDLVRDSLRFYPRIDPKMVRVVLVHPGSVILPELGPELGAYAQKKLAARGVEIRTNCRLTAADANSVTLSDGTVIQTRTVVWTAGTSPHPLLATLRCPCEKGRLKVNEFLEVEGFPGVWALGDAALVPDIIAGGFHPPTAQHAIREAKTAAGNLTAALRGGKRKPFRFRTLGLLASIGHRTGVAKVFGLKFSGFVAWWLWRTIYLSKLPRLEKKVRVALAWSLDLVFPKDLVQFETVRARGISHTEHGVDMLHAVDMTAAK
jgi:NADH dehydrogenase